MMNKIDLSLQVIEFKRNDYEKVKAFVGGDLGPMTIPRSINGVATCLLSTLDGCKTIKEGDYIVKGSNGKFVTFTKKLINQLME